MSDKCISPWQATGYQNLLFGTFTRGKPRRIIPKVKLKEREVEAVPSYIIIPENQELTREIVLSPIEKSNIDSVLINSLAGKSKKTALYSTSDINPYTYFNSSYSLIQNSGPKPSYNVEVLFLKTNFYDVSSEKLVRSMVYESEVTYNTKSLSSVVTFVVN